MSLHSDEIKQFDKIIDMLKRGDQVKVISKKPECFSISLKEISANNFILSPGYYIEKKKHNKINKWFKELSLQDKEMLKSYFEFLKKEG